MIEPIWRLRHRLSHFRRRMTYRIEDEVWSLRLWLVFHLVGNKSFAANIHVVGSLHLEKTTFGGPMIRDVFIFDTEERRKSFKEESK
jgi:hypothetical protein